MQMTIALLFVVFMAWTEGYRGFQLSYAPKFALRAATLRDQATVLQAILAPVYCMGLAWAPARTLIANWALLILILMLVLAFGVVPQPWRGILMAALSSGWGCLPLVQRLATACLKVELSLYGGHVGVNRRAGETSRSASSGCVP